MIAPRIAGRRCCHSKPGSSRSSLVTVMKSLPKKTLETPGTSNSRKASGDGAAASGVRNSAVPSPSTARPGRNFKVAGLGVASVWMNIGILRAGICRKFVRLSSIYLRFGTDSKGAGQFKECAVRRPSRCPRRSWRWGARRTGIENAAPRPATEATSGPGPSFASPAASTSCAMSLSSSISASTSSRVTPSRTTSSGSILARFAGIAGKLVERGVRLLAGLGAHDFLNADPVLEIARRADIEQHEAAIGLLRPPSGIEHGLAAFGRAVDDRKKLALVAFLVDLPSADHGVLLSRHAAAKQVRARLGARFRLCTVTR